MKFTSNPAAGSLKRKSSLKNRNIITTDGRSSMRLEPELWAALDDICRREGVKLSGLIPYIEGQQRKGGRLSRDNLSEKIRQSG